MAPDIKGTKGARTHLSSVLIPFVVALLWGYICIPLVAMTLEFLFRDNPLDFTSNISDFVFGVPPFNWWAVLFAMGDVVPIGIGVGTWAASIALLIYYVNPTFAARATSLFGPSEHLNHSHGSAHVDMKPSELKSTCATWKPGEPIPYSGGGRGFVYGTAKDGRSYVSSGQSHFFIWGPPGTGKTRNLLEPSITYMSYANPEKITYESARKLAGCDLKPGARIVLPGRDGSVEGGTTLYCDEEGCVWRSVNAMGDHIIATDPKGELFSAQRRNVLRNGYEVLVFDLKNPDRSKQYNPLWRITKTYRAIRARADDIVKRAIETYSDDTNKGCTEEEKNSKFQASMARADALYQRAEAKADELSGDLAECIVHVNQDSEGAFWGNSARYYVCAWINFIATYERDAYVKKYQAVINRLLSEGKRTEADALVDKINALPAAIDDAQRNLASVYHCIATHDNKETKSVFGFLPSEHPVRMNYAQMEKSEGTTEMNIRSSALSAIKQNINETFRQISGASDFDLEDFGRTNRKLALFIITDDTKESANVPAVMLINQLYQTACATADSLGGTCPRRIHFILEELTNLGIAIPHLDSAMAMCRSRNIWFYLAIQDLALLRKRYGEHADEELMASTNTICFLATNNKATAKDVSERLGDMTIESESKNRSSGAQALSGRSGETTSLTARAWMDTAEVMKFNAKNLGLLVFRKDLDTTPENYAGVCNPALFPFPDLSRTPFDKIIGLGSKTHQAAWALADSKIDNAVGRPRPQIWRGNHASLADALMSQGTNSFVPSEEVASAIQDAAQDARAAGIPISLELSQKVGLVSARISRAAHASALAPKDVGEHTPDKKECFVTPNPPDLKKEATLPKEKTSTNSKENKEKKLTSGARRRAVDAQMEVIKDFVCPKTKEMMDEFCVLEDEGKGSFDRKAFLAIKQQELKAWQNNLSTHLARDPSFVAAPPRALLYERELEACFTPYSEACEPELAPEPEPEASSSPPTPGLPPETASAPDPESEGGLDAFDWGDFCMDELFAGWKPVR